MPKIMHPDFETYPKYVEGHEFIKLIKMRLTEIERELEDIEDMPPNHRQYMKAKEERLRKLYNINLDWLKFLDPKAQIAN